LGKEPEDLKKIKRYKIVRAIGEGGMGRVYLAKDKIIRRPVAIKVFSLDDLESPKASKKKIMRDFFTETRTAGALLHPNIVVVYDVGKKDDLLYLVMEFVYGKTLLDQHRSAGLSVRSCLETIYEMALALDYAHGEGVVHRDIKPENIIVSGRGVPKLTDFGIARFRDNLKDKAQAVVGSARFMAPEQVLRREQDHRVDIYQLGVVLFELLTRRSPFKGSSPEDTLAKVCTEQPPPPGRHNPDVSERVDNIVLRCLQKSPADRFETARDLADELAGCLRNGVHRAATPDNHLVDSLGKFEMFSLFSADEIQEIMNAGKFITCEAGQPIIMEKDSDSNFFVLLEGNVKVVKRSRVITDFLPGACFGEIGAFARQKRSAAVIAMDDCKLLQINALLVQELDPQLQLKMLHSVVRNMASLVISLDDEIAQRSEETPLRATTHTVCPLCGFDNRAPIEVCPQCGVIPSRYPSSEREQLRMRPREPATTRGRTTVVTYEPTETIEDTVWLETTDSQEDAEEMWEPTQALDTLSVPYPTDSHEFDTLDISEPNETQDTDSLPGRLDALRLEAEDLSEFTDTIKIHAPMDPPGSDTSDTREMFEPTKTIEIETFLFSKGSLDLETAEIEGPTDTTDFSGSPDNQDSDDKENREPGDRKR